MYSMTEDEKQAICQFIDGMENIDPELNKIINDNFSKLIEANP